MPHCARPARGRNDLAIFAGELAPMPWDILFVISAVLVGSAYVLASGLRL